MQSLVSFPGRSNRLLSFVSPAQLKAAILNACMRLVFFHGVGFLFIYIASSFFIASNAPLYLLWVKGANDVQLQVYGINDRALPYFSPTMMAFLHTCEI